MEACKDSIEGTEAVIKARVAGPAEDVTLRNEVGVIWLVMTGAEPWARAIHVKMNATESDRERKREALESRHPGLVVPDRWPVRHEQLMCTIVCFPNKRARQQLPLPCCPLLSLHPVYFGSAVNLIQLRVGLLCRALPQPRRGRGINIKREGTVRIILRL